MASQVEAAASRKPTKIRRRAPKACLSCRARKVRCDVSQRGRPCMNCYLDSETCVVTSRASRLRKQKPPTAEPEDAAFLPPAFISGDELHSQSCAQDDGHVHEATSFVPDEADRPQAHSHSPDTAQTHAHAQSHAHPENGRDTAAGLGLGALNGLGTPWADQQDLRVDITYSYYPFLVASNLANILPQDVNYLELQGCLRVPTRAILDEFIQQYFLHVHPLFPLIHEGDFWDMYCQQGSSPSDAQISLLVFQAMLFSACNFISRSSIRTFGFATIRAARATLYRRAKLLFDFETEQSPAAMTQAALLLSFWTPPLASPPSSKMPNTAWLSTAVQQAHLAEAPHYASMTAPRDARRVNALKRIWWCCILRDRVLGLGVRRSLHITREHFDIDAHPRLERADLADEMARSRVYNPDTKSSLMDILVYMVDLCVILTDLMTLVFPLDDTPGWRRRQPCSVADDSCRIQLCEAALHRWYKETSPKLALLGGTGHKFRHNSIILYTNLLYMYYHSSRVALCHYEMLRIAVAHVDTPADIPVYEKRFELQDAAAGVTECLKELVQRHLARWLPISAVACTALPLFLHILDLKLRTSSASSSIPPASSAETKTTSSALKQHRLNILIEAMKTYQPQYDGVDLISDAIRYVIDLAQLDGPGSHSAGASPGSRPLAGWLDLLASNPSWYLRMALTVDLALSKNRMPEERDFPVGLRELFGNASATTATAAAASNVSPNDFAASTCTLPASSDDLSGSTLFMSPHQLAIGMGAALGLDLDGDMDMGMDFMPLGLDGIETATAATAGSGANGLVAQPSSSDNSAFSPTSTPSGMTDHGSSRNGSTSATSVFHLDAFSFDTDETASDAAAVPRSVAAMAEEHDSEWVRPAWTDEDGTEMRDGDRDTARALLEAMSD